MFTSSRPITVTPHLHINSYLFILNSFDSPDYSDMSNQEKILRPLLDFSLPLPGYRIGLLLFVFVNSSITGLKHTETVERNGLLPFSLIIFPYITNIIITKRYVCLLMLISG